MGEKVKNANFPPGKFSGQKAYIPPGCRDQTLACFACLGNLSPAPASYLQLFGLSLDALSSSSDYLSGGLAFARSAVGRVFQQRV
jgi:hypothetical protein